MRSSTTAHPSTRRSLSCDAFPRSLPPGARNAAGYSEVVRTADPHDDRLPLAARVAREVLSVGVGGRLPITSELQQRYGVGSGTVQRALSEVREHGAALRPRGQRGTFVTDIDLPALWSLAQLGSVDILLPATESAEMKALIAALSRAVDSTVGADLTVSVQSGASSRIDAVREGRADGAVMSSGALEHVAGVAVDRDPSITVRGGWCIVSMGHGSYYRDGSIQVIARDPDRTTWARVGVDPRSSDHVRLSDAEFRGSDVEVVDAPFVRVPALVHDGTIDAGIWHRVDTLFSPESVGLAMLPLDAPDSAELLAAMSSAVIATPETSPLHRVLELIGPHKLVELGNPHEIVSPTVSLRIVARR